MNKLELDMMKELMDYEKFNQKTTKTARGGVNALELLTIVFIVLKLCKVVPWSWLWVLSPIWITWLLAIIVVIVLVILERMGKIIIWNGKIIRKKD